MRGVFSDCGNEFWLCENPNCPFYFKIEPYSIIIEAQDGEEFYYKPNNLSILNKRACELDLAVGEGSEEPLSGTKEGTPQDRGVGERTAEI